MSFPWPVFELVVATWALLAVPVFVAGLAGWDPAGRMGGRGLGKRLNSRWGWFAMESPALVTFPLVYLLSGNLHVVGNIVLALWLAHYAHRTLLWPWLIQKRSATVSSTMLIGAVAFNLVNGIFWGWFMGGIADYAEQWLTDPRFLSGLALTIAGAGLNIQADYRLLHLRKLNSGRHVVPHGGAFELVSCPNLSGEIIEWLGFALLTWSLPGLAFALWTIANLAPRAVWRRNWYRENFSDYPKQRPALFPGIL